MGSAKLNFGPLSVVCLGSSSSILCTSLSSFRVS